MKSFTVKADDASAYVLDAVDAPAAMQEAKRRHPYARRLVVKQIRRYIRGGKWISGAPRPGSA